MSTATRCRSPGRDYNGPVSFSYKVIDGQGASVAPTQSFCLAAVNDSPTVVLSNGDIDARNR